jgi:hypothetical protein
MWAICNVGELAVGDAGWAKATVVPSSINAAPAQAASFKVMIVAPELSANLPNPRVHFHPPQPLVEKFSG